MGVTFSLESSRDHLAKLQEQEQPVEGIWARSTNSLFRAIRGGTTCTFFIGASVDDKRRLTVDGMIWQRRTLVPGEDEDHPGMVLDDAPMDPFVLTDKKPERDQYRSKENKPAGWRVSE